MIIFLKASKSISKPISQVPDCLFRISDGKFGFVWVKIAVFFADFCIIRKFIAKNFKIYTQYG